MNDSILDNLLTKEKETNIYKERICNFPLWAYVRREYRNKYIFSNGGDSPLSNFSQFRLIPLLNSFIKSLFHITTLFIHSKKVSNLFLGFMRLEQIDGVYVDKFVDPIIRISTIKDDYIYMERGRSGVHCSPRFVNNIIWTEAIDFICIVCAYILFPIFYIFNYKKYNRFYHSLNQIFPITLKDKIKIANKTTNGLIKIFVLYLLFRKLGVKRVYLPVAVLHYPYIGACKKLKIPCYEIQHGITVGRTSTYSGEYVPEAYPDYFLVFGCCFMKDFLFGIPIDKMMNIGCAFKELIRQRSAIPLKNTYLILSDPEVTQKIVNTTVELAQMYPEYTFHLRLHPLERLNQSQIKVLSVFPNVKCVETINNSTITCMSYEGVIAENTSVLYEAVSVGVKAARLQYNGLHTIHFLDEPANIFFYMKKPEDLKTFIDNFKLGDVNKELYYSSFNHHLFNQILNQ